MFGRYLLAFFFLTSVGFALAQSYEYAIVELSTTTVKSDSALVREISYHEGGTHLLFEAEPDESIYASFLFVAGEDLDLLDDADEGRMLNHMGERGYELISIFISEDDTKKFNTERFKYYFKRQVEESLF